MKRTLAALIVSGSLILQTWTSAAVLPEPAGNLIKASVELAQADYAGNAATIKVLLTQCKDLTDDEKIVQILDSILFLMDSGTADAVSVTTLLNSLLEEPETGTQGQQGGYNRENSAVNENDSSAQVEPEEAPTEPGTETEAEPEPAEEPAAMPEVNEDGLPIYRDASLVQTVIPERVMIDVPGNWGNNASGRAVTQYSPVNESGAISPAAGTLTISYFPIETEDEEAAFDEYEKNISDMSVVSGMSSEKVTAADMAGRKLSFIMNVGANQFTCKTVCFACDHTIYAIELLQGQQTEYDYFPMFEDVVGSTEIGSDANVDETTQQAGDLFGGEEPETEPGLSGGEEQETEPELSGGEEQGTGSGLFGGEEPETEPELSGGEEQGTGSGLFGGDEQQTEEEPPSMVPVGQETAGSMGETEGDLGSFMYSLNGHQYQFPTAVSEISGGDLELNRALTIPYDFKSDADMAEGYWTEITNTQYFYYENAQYKEMAGVTNMSGYPVPMTECMLTALIDTQGDFVDIILPGNIRVGSPESAIAGQFPEFAGRAMDGLAGFRGNELLYACNVRGDGCNGYVLIRNDYPYYSAVSIICENGIIKEISFECLGAERAAGVFLD